MSAIDSAWFFEKLSEKKASLRSLARFMTLDPSAVSLMLNGKRKMSADEQDQIAVFLGVGLEELAKHRRNGDTGFSEKNHTPYDAKSDMAFVADVPTRMIGFADLEYEDGKLWVELENGKRLEAHPALGCMRGTVTIPDDLDLTAPADPGWGNVYNDE